MSQTTPTLIAPGADYAGPRRTLPQMNADEARGRTVEARAGRESVERGEITTGERFRVLRRDERGWELQQEGGERIVRGVPSMLLKLVEEP